MDLDPYGADLSGESQLNLSPASGLDPTRQVKYVPTAATAVYPNVTSPLYASVETTDVTPRPARALSVVPVVGQNVAEAPVALQAPNPVRLAPTAPSYQPPAQQTAQAAPERPIQHPPGAGQGIGGTDRLAIPPYQAGADSQEIQRRLLQTEAEKWEAYARNPWNNLMNSKEVQQATEYAAQQRGKINEIDKAQQQERDIQAKAANSGLSVGPKATNETIKEGLIRKYLSGDPVAVANAEAALKARGYAAEAEGYKPQAVSAMEGTLVARNKLQQRLDTAATDKQYNEIRDEIGDTPGFSVPKSLGEYEKTAALRRDAFNRAKVMIDRYRTTQAQQTDYTPITDEKVAKVAAGKATFYDGTPMPGATGVQHGSHLAIGGQAQTGSHDIMSYGREWGAFTGSAQKDYQEQMIKDFPPGERGKYLGLARIYQGATRDAKGNPLPRGELNTNPNMLQGLSEVMTAELRESANAGANASMMKLELGNRGWAQNKIDDLVKNWAGIKGEATGKEQKYLSKLTQQEKRDVLEFLMAQANVNTGARINNTVRNAGMHGATEKELNLEPALMDAPGVREAYAYGRDKQIEHMGRQYRNIAEDYSVFLGNDNAARLVPGAKRTPVPATSLPGLYPELAAPPPAATSAPGGGGGASPSGTTPLPQPGGGGSSPFTGGAAPVPFAPAGPVPAPVAPAAGGLRPLAAMPAASLVQSLAPRPTAPVQTAQATLPSSWGVGMGAGGPAPIAPTVPTPAAPGGPGTGAPPPSAPAPPGARGGGTFTQGVPSGGFPAPINGNQVARTVYGTAGQTAQNATNNPVIASNSAIVAASSAQSESSFDPNKSHDNKTGYGLFGHRLDRLTAMHAFAGTKPGDPIPPNVQAAFYTREMSRAGDTDPFIAQVLRNPNASAEDLTRVQMRMERPQGYRGPGTEEQGHNWAGRLANTRALMAGGQPAAIAAAPAAPVVAAPQPAGSLLNPRVALQSIQQKAAAVPAREVFQNSPNLAPAVLGTGGALVGGAVAGPPGAVAGGALGGAAGGAIKNYYAGAPEQQTPVGYLKEGAFGAAQGATMGITGGGVVPTVARITLSSIIPGFEKYVEGKSGGEVVDAAVWGLVGGVSGESFGRALGAGGNALWKASSGATKAELMSVGKTLATEQPKIMDAATGKLVENVNYTKAMARAKQLGQDPDNLSHGWKTAEQNVEGSQTGHPAPGVDARIPPTRGEALTQRPGQVEQLRVGREEYNPIREEIAGAGAKATPSVPFKAQFAHDPVAIVGVHPDVPAKFMDDAVTTRSIMNQKASSWREIWNNNVDARARLLNKQREAEDMTGAGKKEAQDAYRALADEVRKQQQHIAETLLPKAQADSLIQRLEVADNHYRKAMTAGGNDIVAAIAKGGDKGREAQAAFNALSANDPAARQMMNSLLKLHAKQAVQAARTSGDIKAIAAAEAAIRYLPGGHYIAGAGVLYKSFHALQDYLAARGAGSMVKFEDMLRRDVQKVRPVPRAAVGAPLGGRAALPAAQAVGLAEPAQ